MIDPTLTAPLVAAEGDVKQALVSFRHAPTEEFHALACAAVEGYVDLLRAAGESPEAVVIAVKKLAQEVGLRESSSRSAATANAHDERVTAFVSCAIARYFKDSSQA